MVLYKPQLKLNRFRDSSQNPESYFRISRKHFSVLRLGADIFNEIMAGRAIIYGKTIISIVRIKSDAFLGVQSSAYIVNENKYRPCRYIPPPLGIYVSFSYIDFQVLTFSVSLTSKRRAELRRFLQ